MRNNYLISLKPLEHNTKIASYSVLAEIDWKTRRLLRSIKFPAANFTNRHSYMRSFSQGICLHNGMIFVGGWNYIAIIDYESFQIVDSFSHPLMSDIHGLVVTDSDIIVCSTSIDALLCFDRNDYELKWMWRVDDSGLIKKLEIPKLVFHLRRKFPNFDKTMRFLNLGDKIKARFLEKDFRSIDKTRSFLHFYHLNEVATKGDKLYALTKGWNDLHFDSSSVIQLNTDGESATFLAQPGSFCGAHDLLFYEDMLYVTESGSESVGLMTLSGDISHRKLSDNHYFIRGIDACESGFLVGFSPDRYGRSGSTQPHIREYDAEFQEARAIMQLDMFYPGRVGGAVHNVLRVV